MFDFFGTQTKEKPKTVVPKTTTPPVFKRFEKNPIITPDRAFAWRSFAVFSPTAIYLDGKVRILFRAQGQDKVSCLGYAESENGYDITEVSKDPAYVPREGFEMSKKAGWNSGCEDPRITQIDDSIYLTYTAYDGVNPPRVALSTLSVDNFLQKIWKWTMPKLISPPGVDDKDACIIKNPKGDGYLAFHRLGNAMWIDSLRDLNFPEVKFLTGGIVATPRPDKWDNVKIGLASPPIVTKKGLLIFYHAVSNPGFVYKIGALLLDKNNPKTVISRTDTPLLAPETPYELNGQVPNAVFSCGAVVIGENVFLYYGGADTVVGVATIPLEGLLEVM